MGKLKYPGIDLYEEQLLWVRIFEAICRIDCRNQVPKPIEVLEKKAWSIYDGLNAPPLDKRVADD